jgi:predicted TIM-barrel fold metal-dependent hydrolase
MAGRIDALGSIFSASGRLAPPAGRETVFDAHCHLFNVDYLLHEILQILWDMIHGTYPLPTDSMIEESVVVRPDFEVRSPLDAAEHFLAWIIEIGAAAIGSEAAHARELRRNAARVWGVDTISLVALMMDIYFMFAPRLGPPGAVDRAPAGQRPLPRATGGDDLDARARTFRKSVARALRRRRDIVAAKGRAHRPALAVIENLLEAVAARVLGLSTKQAVHGGRGFQGTAGFTRQFRALSALGSRTTGIYPFIAVDPRREGIVEWVITSGQVGPAGPFHGVKLYPRLGCHPLRPELDPLYSHCAQKGIPLTTHCSSGGFPDFVTSFAEFGNPENFRPIFERFPSIRIDFAHFGDRGADTTQSEAWGRSIAGLLRDFPGAYADLSCYTHEESFERFTALFQDLPNVRERTMFGSDFDVLYFTEPGTTLERYYRRFLDIFGSERLLQMASRVPMEFLGLRPSQRPGGHRRG